MSEFLAKLVTLAGYLPRAVLIVLALCAPVFAMPGIIGGPDTVIEHNQKKSNGVGFVLMMSLQR